MLIYSIVASAAAAPMRVSAAACGLQPMLMLMITPRIARNPRMRSAMVSGLGSGVKYGMILFFLVLGGYCWKLVETKSLALMLSHQLLAVEIQLLNG